MIVYRNGDFRVRAILTSLIVERVSGRVIEPLAPEEIEEAVRTCDELAMLESGIAA